MGHPPVIDTAGCPFAAANRPQSTGVGGPQKRYLAARGLLAAAPHNPQGFLVLARCALHTGRTGEAAQAAAECIGLQFGNPQGQFLLGAALASQERFEEAMLRDGRAGRLDHCRRG
jgi:cytochrome c-type biogenesis protein CcmH/NrfG